MNALGHGGSVMEASRSSQPPGVFTKTVVRSPVIQWILHASIRHTRCNDSLFVGADFVHVKQIDSRGQLMHIATKDDFGAPIRAANVLSPGSDRPGFDDLMKQEDDGSLSMTTGNPLLPPDLLVLALGWPLNELVFVYLTFDGNGNAKFVQHGLALPTFGLRREELGAHLAVESRSRAIAVAANERQILLYSVKSKARMQDDMEKNSESWLPCYAEMAVQVDGAIVHTDFLLLPDDDNDHIALLVITVDQGRAPTKATYIDWNDRSPMDKGLFRPGLPLEFDRSVPTLLVPLRNAGFLLGSGGDIHHYVGILSGSIRRTAFGALDYPPCHPGGSPQKPAWVSWCRPARTSTFKLEKDAIYLIREDGVMLYLVYNVNNTSFNCSKAGRVDCHVGKAFASFGTPEDPDILAVAGDKSDGGIVVCGNLRTHGRRVPENTWDGTMSMKLVQNLPNWSGSVSGLLVSRLPQTHPMRPRDGIFVTSGRQPYGAITETRQGLAARLTGVTDNDVAPFLNSVTDIWTLSVGDGTLLAVLAGPDTTWLLSYHSLSDDSVLLDEDDASALDLENRTLVAATAISGILVQVTEKCICMTTQLKANFEDSIRLSRVSDDRIVVAAIEPYASVLITAERSGSDFLLHVYGIFEGDNDQLTPATTIPLDSRPLAIAVLGKFAVVATADSILHFLTIDSNGLAQFRGKQVLLDAGDGKGVCDSVIIMRSPKLTKMLIVCGLRDGQLHSLSVDISTEQDFRPLSMHNIQFGQSAVKVTKLSDDGSTVCVTSGADICHLSWDGTDAQSLVIENIWFSDKNCPERKQGAVTACASIPGPPLANMFNDNILSDAATNRILMMVSAGQLLIASLDDLISTVPRQIRVEGTPTHLIYVEKQQCLVCASQRTVALIPKASAPAVANRQVFPAIEFFSTRDGIPPFTHDLDPVDRVYALMDWSFTRTEEAQNGKAPEKSKSYCFILVGGSRTSASNPRSATGRITFLQPQHKNWEVVGVRTQRPINLDATVYALAAYDSMTIVVCYGKNVVLYAFDSQSWKPVCEPFPLANRGKSITVSRPLVYISTFGDSLVTLRLAHIDNVTQLVSHHNAPSAATAFSHVVVHSSVHDEENITSSDIALISAPYGQLLGLSSPPPAVTITSASKSAQLLFEATLPMTLTCLSAGSIRPSWRADPPPGVYTADLLGSATDGTIIGLALLDHSLWRRLAWLQRLCEWSEAFSPHSLREKNYSPLEDGEGDSQRAMPVGLAAGGEQEEVVMSTFRKARAQDMHIDGDIISRVLRPGGAEQLKRDIEGMALKGGDRVRGWVAEHLQEELDAVDEVVELVRRLIGCWI